MLCGDTLGVVTAHGLAARGTTAAAVPAVGSAGTAVAEADSLLAAASCGRPAACDAEGLARCTMQRMGGVP